MECSVFLFERRGSSLFFFFYLIKSIISKEKNNVLQKGWLTKNVTEKNNRRERRAEGQKRPSKPCTIAFACVSEMVKGGDFLPCGSVGILFYSFLTVTGDVAVCLSSVLLIRFVCILPCLLLCDVLQIPVLFSGHCFV